jgi:hypothetical protein
MMEKKKYEIWIRAKVNPGVNPIEKIDKKVLNSCLVIYFMLNNKPKVTI